VSGFAQPFSLRRGQAMTFEEEHPKAFVHFTTADGFMKGSGQARECAYCDGPTTWFQKALGLYFCSRECHRNYAARPRSTSDPNRDS
jgi:hypothetical protein